MKNYNNYLKAVTADVIDFIRNEVNAADYENREALPEFLNDELWTCDSENGTAGGLYKASICPHRSGLYNPPALAQRYHNRCIPSVWLRFKALSLLSCFAIFPIPLYLRLNAYRIV